MSKLKTRTIDSFKVVFIDSFGCISEYDTEDETEARRYAATVQNSIIYHIRIMGDIVRLI